MELNQLDKLYSDPILDHCRHPRNSDFVEASDVSERSVNPFCGDEVDLQILLEDSRVCRVGVQVRGCSINQASASMLSEAISGKTVEEMKVLTDLFVGLLRGREFPKEEIDKLGDLKALFGVRQFPVRIKCALLAWSALEGGLQDYRWVGAD